MNKGSLVLVVALFIGGCGVSMNEYTSAVEGHRYKQQKIREESKKEIDKLKENHKKEIRMLHEQLSDVMGRVVELEQLKFQLDDMSKTFAERERELLREIMLLKNK